MSHFIRIGKEQVYYDRNDSTARPVLIPIHGSGGRGAHWPEALRRWPAAGVYTPDLPGHGRSTGDGRTSVADYAGVLDAFVTALGLEKVILMGHSIGGAIAMTSALRSPAWLTGLILVGTGARLRVTRSILDGLLSDFDAAVDIICGLLFGPSAPESLMDLVRQDMRATSPRVIHGDFSACDRFDIMDRIGEIRYPCLIVSGARDMLTPPKYGEYLSKRIAGARHVVIEGAGHMIAQERPAEFLRAVSDFISFSDTVRPG